MRKIAVKVVVIAALSTVASVGCSFWMVRPIKWGAVNEVKPTPVFAQTVVPSAPTLAEQLRTGHPLVK